MPACIYIISGADKEPSSALGVCGSDDTEDQVFARWLSQQPPLAGVAPMESSRYCISGRTSVDLAFWASQAGRPNDRGQDSFVVTIPKNHIAGNCFECQGSKKAKHHLPDNSLAFGYSSERCTPFTLPRTSLGPDEGGGPPDLEHGHAAVASTNLS
ncbi:hypothetical protein CPAR01_15830 [Colletotrichum paranaense]|uniref:Uncharacterized protein n=1 Tax=Colletotrichum paranaense TaxID=1914294 RepID=A0ABQ9RY08_9PEZI|nr:uncharacterized protein CPAR01_15830 [Colletotrichum paranaense]KAK1518181.1 hypothetical protein CPAR01_15830 [Colletotrichum paranaense]